ncbi:MAG: ACP phosphodiesterase [Luteibaculum sp.]
MNFLGHGYLSGGNSELTVGNFIADGVKVKNYLKYPDEIKKGILLHRSIDNYTDDYDGFNPLKRSLYPLAGKMTPVVIDIYIDHLLAANWADFHPASLKDFSRWFYATIDEHNMLPGRVKQFYPYMKSGNWLLRYADEEGFKWATVNIGRRIGFEQDLNGAVSFCLEAKDDFLPIFYHFAHKIKEHVQDYLNNYPTL